MSIDLSGHFTSDFDPTALRTYVEDAYRVELTDTLIGRNLCSDIFKFPNNAKSYVFKMRTHTRATVIEEMGAPPVVRYGVRKFGMEYLKIGVATGITDDMLIFSDAVDMKSALTAALRGMRLLQDRHIFNCAIESVPFYHNGSTPIYIRLQQADLKQEWRTGVIVDDAKNKCSKGNSHVIVGDGNDADSQTGGTYPAPPQVDSSDVNLEFILNTLHYAVELIEEHPERHANVMLISYKQKTDFKNFLDPTGSNKPSIAPPQFNAVMLDGWAGRWEGIDVIATHSMNPGTALIMDTKHALVLGEFGAPYLEGDVRDPWKAWTAGIFRQWYDPATIDTESIVVILNLIGDKNKADGTPLNHTIKAESDAQYTGLPIAGGEIAGLPG